jgi:hypothetical protein
MVSNLFLLLTFLVFLAFPELRSTLPGKLEMAFVASLFMAYLLLAISNFAGTSIYTSFL